MKRYLGGERVSEGMYLSRSEWEFVDIPSPGGTLPGDASTQYVRVAVPLVLALGPLLGLGYVIYLPLLGFAIVGMYLGHQAWRLARAISQPVGRTVAVPAWRLGMSYLGRRERRELRPGAPKVERPQPKPELTGRLKELKEEIEKRRQSEGE